MNYTDIVQTTNEAWFASSTRLFKWASESKTEAKDSQVINAFYELFSFKNNKKKKHT